MATNEELVNIKNSVMNLTQTVNGMFGASDEEEANAWAVIYNKRVNAIMAYIDKMMVHDEPVDESDEAEDGDSEIMDNRMDTDTAIREFAGQ